MSDCELPKFYFHSEPVARKQHVCCECDAPIHIGEKHLAVRAKWDGPAETFRQHFQCEKACELVRDGGFNDDECLAFGELLVWWREEIKGNWRWPYHPSEMEKRRKLWVLMLGIHRRQRKESHSKSEVLSAS